MKILVTAIGSTTGISVARLIKKTFNTVIGTDILPREQIAGASFCDTFYQVPPADSENYIGFLSILAKELEIKMIIPCSDEEVEVLSKNLDAFENIYVTIPKPDSVEVCRDKLKTYEFFYERGIPTPLTKSGKFSNYISLGFPFILKPRKGRGTRGIYEIRNLIDLHAFLGDDEDNYILQEKLEGREFTVDVFSIDKSVIASIPRWRNETRDGKSINTTTFHSNEIDKYIEKICYYLTMNCVFCVQGFVTNKGIYFTEINPRPSATLIAADYAGMNLIEALIKSTYPPGITNLPDDFKEITVLRYLYDMVIE